MGWFAHPLGVVAASLLACAAFAQDFASARITGTVGAPLSEGGSVQVDFTCTGTPACQGTYKLHIQNQGCSNAFELSSPMSWTGIDISKAGNFLVTIFLSSSSSRAIGSM